MQDNNINIEDKENVTENSVVEEITVDTNEESVENTEPPKAIEDEDDPINEYSIQQIGQLLKQVKEMVQMMEGQWNTSKSEFKLTDTHMKQLYQYNELNRTEMPEGLSDEERDTWDRFNGLDNIPEDTVFEIFGEDHPIIGVDHPQTVDRIKYCVEDFFNWLAALKEYHEIHNAYLQLIDIEEDKNIEQLKLVADNEEDPEKKQKLQDSIKLYYNRKYLDFIAEELTDESKNRLVNTFNDGKKIEYWVNRTKDKLDQMKISPKFILEISQFEKRFLPEKYHKCSNMLLLYFMQTVIYSTNDNGKFMVIALDNVVRKSWPQDKIDKVINNIISMLDQVIDLIPDQETNNQ